MQIWLVHMREPRQLFRDLGGAGMVAFQLIVGGNALVPLLHSVFIVGLMLGLQVGIGRRWLGGFRRTDALCRGGRRRVFDFGLYRLAGAGLSRSAKQDFRFAVYAIPLAAALDGSVAGACELIWTPFGWRKTEHGLDDASRQERTTRSLLELERLVSGLIRRGELAQIHN
jgi:glycosyltransferase XagB